MFTPESEYIVYLVFILWILLFRYVLGVLSGWLNLRSLSSALPEEFQGYYDPERYKRSQEYLRDNTRFGFVVSTLSVVTIVAFILIGGFNLVDRVARSVQGGADHPIITGLIFAAILTCGQRILGIPFSIYQTFVIEERYGFNKTTPSTFIADFLKGVVLTALIGGPIFALMIWLFESAGPLAWLYCWVALTAINVFLVFIAPYVIMPLFNRFEPLEEGELRSEIERYAKSQDFTMQGVYKMDGSRRSAKSNAFFTGFGASRRIALFDTLIEKHTVPELVSVIAHEMGHYKKKHVMRHIVMSILQSGLMLALLSLFIENEQLFRAFGMEKTSVYASLVFFGFLYSPLAMILGILGKIVSRRCEYEADAYAVETVGDSGAMIEALKKLSVNNLGNLTPHPLKVFLSYSHPPVLDRIAALRSG